MTAPDVSRLIDLPGCLNLRDVGGYRTRSGAEVAWRRLFRSGSMTGIVGDAATQLVHRIGVRRVIDLRTAEEIAELMAADLPPPCTLSHVPLFEAIRPHWVRPHDRGPDATAQRYLEMLEEGAAAVACVVELLGDAASTPTVIHCAAGLDRTGIVLACVLDLLGVPDAAIAGDYALSDAVLDDGGHAHPDTVLGLFELLRARHGSTRAFLIERGCPAPAIDRLATALLAT